MISQIQIKSVYVENVRGISSANFHFETPDMIGNKFHIIVAPNGFGKSSLAMAFDSLRPRSLKLHESVFHNGDETKKPKVEITYVQDGVERKLKADASCNEIARKFSTFVINSKVKPRAVAKSGFQPHAKPTASLIIEPVILVNSIPVKPTRNLNPPKIKVKFGLAGKVLQSVESFLENDLLLKDVLSLSQIKKFQKKTVWKAIDEIVAKISLQLGTVEQLELWIEANELKQLKAIPELVALAELFVDFPQLSEVDRYLVAYQFAKYYEEDEKFLVEQYAWMSYKRSKKRCSELLRSVNSNPAWINVSVKETKGTLIAEFPVATKMSNGQRDLLVFVAQLLKAEFELTEKCAILIVDEVFDYLDECNLLAAQFYVSRFVDRFKSNGNIIFPIFLTHLNPEVFKHSVFGLGSKDTRKVHLLDKAGDSSRKVGIAQMVRLRDDASLKPFIGKYFFHFHPQNCDQVALFQSKGLKSKWGKSHEFYSYAIEEFNKYIKGAAEADHVAACVAARVAIEKHAFDQLSSVEQKSRFTDEFNKRTTDKLDFVESVGGKVPDVHRLLGLLYNDILHHKDHFDYISAIVSKMKNPAVRGMMAEIPMPTSY